MTTSPQLHHQPGPGQGETGNSHFQSHYIPNTLDEQRKVLSTLGLNSVDDLFLDIPESFRNPSLNLPGPLSELEIQQELAALASRNRPLNSGPSFLGAGSYHHFVPAVIKALVTRGEFLTAYTPYQAEASQGTLQVIFEFQTLVCNLFDMEVANAGMYDGATGLAEGVLMACRVTKRNKVVLSQTLSPTYQRVIRTYCQAQGIETVTVAPENFSENSSIDGEAACFVVQYPNYFGYIEDLGKQTAAAHDQGALIVVSTDATALGMFNPPGHFGADIVTAEGQPLGIPASFGGPYVGLFATKEEFIRQMPSRLSGRTVDTRGNTGYVLTLQTREQHIRRERATSNICTNEALYALAATVYLAAMGKQGVRQVAELCYHKAHYAAAKIASLPGYSLPIDGTFFQEFVVRCPAPPAEINRKLLEHNILGGLDLSEPSFLDPSHGERLSSFPPNEGGIKGGLSNCMLLCVTEMNSRQDIDALVSALSEVA